MIINHEHKFCFFAIPRTGSKSVSKVLVEQFGSEEILRMHAGYDEFMEQAKRHEKKYFTFATVRNPMDSVVSAYFKKKSDHNGRFSRGTFKEGRPIGERAMAEYRFIVEQEADFATYFMHFYHEPYRLPRHERTAEAVDHLMRFETLEADFKSVLSKLGLPCLQAQGRQAQVDLPNYNSTAGRATDYLSYYTPETHERAKKVFGPLMKKWGYAFL
ncbi:MAG: sulfotransferase family 2 domain-containing protein [Bacteroidota bacterium]